MFGSPGEHAESALLGAWVSERNTLKREAFRRRLERMKEELAGPRATRLEGLLVPRVALCWMQVCNAERVASITLREREVPLRALEMREQRQERAQRRFVREQGPRPRAADAAL